MTRVLYTLSRPFQFHIPLNSLYFRSHPVRLLSQNFRILLNLRLNSWGVWCKTTLQAVHGPRSQIDFRKYNIVRILHRSNGERSSPSVDTNQADSTSRVQMCMSVEHRYRTSPLLKIEFPFESIILFATWCSRHMNFNVKLYDFSVGTSPKYSKVPMYDNSPIPLTAKLLLKIHLPTHLIDSKHVSSGPWTRQGTINKSEIFEDRINTILYPFIIVTIYSTVYCKSLSFQGIAVKQQSQRTRPALIDNSRFVFLAFGRPVFLLT